MLMIAFAGAGAGMLEAQGRGLQSSTHTGHTGSPASLAQVHVA